MTEETMSSRGFKMGFLALPKGSSWKNYEETFKETSKYGEVIAIKRTPPWEEFMTNATISEQTKDLTILEKDLIAIRNFVDFADLWCLSVPYPCLGAQWKMRFCAADPV